MQVTTDIVIYVICVAKKVLLELTYREIELIFNAIDITRKIKINYFVSNHLCLRNFLLLFFSIDDLKLDVCLLFYNLILPRLMLKTKLYILKIYNMVV